MSKVIVYNSMVLIFFSLITVLVASHGAFFTDLTTYFAIDGIFVIVFIATGIWIVDASCNKTALKFVLFAYYYLMFASFSDGHEAGWMHSIDAPDKLAYIVVSSILFFLTLFIPLIILAMALVHDRLSKYICKSAPTQ